MSCLPFTVNRVPFPVNGQQSTNNLLYSTLLRRPATIMRKRGNILNHHNLDAILRKRTDGAFATCTGTLHININALKTCIECSLSGICGGHLCGVGSVLLRTLEAHFSGAAPGDNLEIGRAHV